MGRARPEAYPVLGEEPCLDTAYVLGMAGPAWCSRCGPPEREGKVGGGGGGRGKRMRRNRRNRAQDGEKRGGRGERRKKVGKDGQIDRQTAQKGRLNIPPPQTHPASPDPGLWLLGSHLGRDGPLRPRAAGSQLTGSQPQGPALLSSQRGTPVPGPLLQARSLLMGKSQRREAQQGDGRQGVRWDRGGQVGTHHSAGTPGTRPSAASSPSAAQAGAGRAATAAADDLQLPLGAVGALQKLLDELLQPQLGAGLPRRRLLQELVDLHHLPGPGAVSDPRASAWLPTHPLEEPPSRRESHGTAAPAHVGARSTGPGTRRHATARTQMQPYTPSHTRAPHCPSPDGPARHPYPARKHSVICGRAQSHLLRAETLSGTQPHTLAYTCSCHVHLQEYTQSETGTVPLTHSNTHTHTHFQKYSQMQKAPGSTHSKAQSHLSIYSQMYSQLFMHPLNIY